MNIITEPTKSEYVRLLRRYLSSEIDEATFGAAFQELQTRHATLEEEKIKSWPERYDVQLSTAYLDGKLSKEEYKKKWTELWGVRRGGWREIVYADLLYLFDRRTKNEEVLKAYQNDQDEYNRTYFIREAELKKELERYLKELESSED